MKKLWWSIIKNKEYFYYCEELDNVLVTTLKTKEGGALVGSEIDSSVFNRPFPDCFLGLFEMKEKCFRYEYIGEI